MSNLCIPVMIRVQILFSEEIDLQRCVNNLNCTSLSNSLDSSGYNAEQFFPSCDHSKHSSANRPLSLIVRTASSCR